MIVLHKRCTRLGRSHTFAFFVCTRPLLAGSGISSSSTRSPSTWCCSTSGWALFLSFRRSHTLGNLQSLTQPSFSVCRWASGRSIGTASSATSCSRWPATVRLTRILSPPLLPRAEAWLLRRASRPSAVSRLACGGRSARPLWLRVGAERRRTQRGVAPARADIACALRERARGEA